MLIKNKVSFLKGWKVKEFLIVFEFQKVITGKEEFIVKSYDLNDENLDEFKKQGDIFNSGINMKEPDN